MSSHFEKREFQRVDLKLLVDIKDQQEKGFTRDVSLGGFRFMSKVDLGKEEEHEFVIFTPEMEEIKAKGHVLRKVTVNSLDLDQDLIDDILEQEDSSKLVETDEGVRILGSLNHLLNFDLLFKDRSPEGFHIFLDSIESYTQSGIGALAAKINEWGGVVYFEKVPQDFFDHFIANPLLHQSSRINSFYLTYICESCAKVKNHFYKTMTLSIRNKAPEDSLECESCSGNMYTNFPVDHDVLALFDGKKPEESSTYQGENFETISLPLFLAENAISMNILSAPIFIVGPSGKIEFANLTARRVFLVVNESESISQIFSESFRDLIDSSIFYSVSLLKRKELENVIFIKGGLKYVFKFSFIPVKDLHGNGVGAVLILQDKSLEYQISSKILELERRSSILSQKVNDVAYLNIDCQNCDFSGKVLDLGDEGIHCPSCNSTNITPVMCFDYGIKFSSIELESQKTLNETIQVYAAQNEAEEGRKHLRYTPQNIQLGLGKDGGSNFSLSNISRGGLEFKSSDELKLGQKISLSIALEGMNQSVDVFCEILRSKSAVIGGEKTFIYGAKFIYFDSSDSQQFEKFFERMLDEEFLRKSKEKVNYKPVAIMAASFVMVIAAIFTFVFFWADDFFTKIDFSKADEKILVLEDERVAMFGKKQLYKTDRILNVPGMGGYGGGAKGDSDKAITDPQIDTSRDGDLDHEFRSSGLMYDIDEFLNMPEEGLKKLKDVGVYDKLQAIKSRNAQGEKIYQQFLSRDLHTTEFMISRIDFYRGRVNRNNLDVGIEKMEKSEEILKVLHARKKRLKAMKREIKEKRDARIKNINYLKNLRASLSPELRQKLDDAEVDISEEEYARIEKMEFSELKSFLREKIDQVSDAGEESFE